MFSESLTSGVASSGPKVFIYHLPLRSRIFEESLWTRCSPQTNAYLSVPLRRIRLRLTPVHPYYFWGVVKDGRRDGEDRKSTRLNSSHVASSYAVFCLTKNKR